jgi:toxin ParE1/3/4
MADFVLRYSPLFYQDLDSITDYVLFELKNKIAAKALVTNVESTIKKRLANPLSVAAYRSIGIRPYPYRRILVGNYLIFYVVIDNIMVVRRLLYGRSDLNRII